MELYCGPELAGYRSEICQSSPLVYILADFFPNSLEHTQPCHQM